MTIKNFSNKLINCIKKVKAIDYLGGKCIKCGEDDIFKLCFHHTDPRKKEYEWVELKQKRWNIIEKEIQKCELLCHNCHVEYHYSLNSNDISKDCINRRYDKHKLLSFKDKIECVECGYNKCVASLEFHHRNKEEKVFMIGKKRIISLTDEIIKEIDKCDIICKNCHVKKHTNVKIFNDNIDLIISRSENYKEKKKTDHNEVYNLYKNGKGVVEISKIFGVNKSTISTIITNIKKRDGLVT